MIEEINIEEIKIGEYKKLKNIVNKQQLYHYNLNGPYKERFLKINEVNFEEFMKKKNKSVTYAAVRKDTIIGFTSAYINNHNEGFVEDLFILEAYRGKAIGTELFKKLLNWLQENDAGTVDVHVSIGNEEVMKFYEKNGFRTTGYTMKKLNGTNYKNINDNEVRIK